MGARRSTHGSTETPEPIRNFAPELLPRRLQEQWEQRTFVELEQQLKGVSMATYTK